MITIRVVYEDMPVSIKGVVHVDIDGFPTCILNSRLGYYQNMLTYKHECEHIRQQDFDKFDADEIERTRHESA